MRDYERQLIKGLSKEEAERLITTINTITAIVNKEVFPPVRYFGEQRNWR